MKSEVCILSCERLSASDPSGRHLLKEVSFRIKAGEKVAIVGPNGAGKSILQKHLCGRFKTLQGNVKLLGKELEAHSPLERAQIMAVMSQSEQIEPLLSVEEYVSLGRIPYLQKSDVKKNVKAVENAIRLCKLNSFRKRTIQTLSGGERQRAALARAIAQSSNLLLLDEPTNHLDLSARAEILSIVRKIPGTVLAILHELSLVENFADRVIVLKKGRVVANGPPSRSLSKTVVSQTFGMSVLSVIHPISGQSVKIFEPKQI